MNALAPSISHAIAAAHADIRNAPICSASHVGHGAAPGQHQTGILEDCGYCLTHAGSFALPTPPLEVLGFLGGHELRPFLFYRAPRPLLALTAAPPRGPPALA